MNGIKLRSTKQIRASKVQRETDLVPLRNIAGRRLRHITVQEARNTPGLKLITHHHGKIKLALQTERCIPPAEPSRDHTWESKVETAAAQFVSRFRATRKFHVQNAIGEHCEGDWQLVLDRYGRKCLRCEVKESDVPLTKDHVVPLSEGGTNYASNLQPLCRQCNSWKGAREIDFRPSSKRDETRLAVA